MLNPFKKIKFCHILWLFFYLFLFTLLLHNSFSYLDPDLGWHLKVGEEISLTGSVPASNHYNYTYTGTWVDHEWLSNLWLYRAYEAWGYIAVSVLFALLVVIVAVLLHRSAKRTAPPGSSGLIVFFLVFGLIAASPSLGVRLQEAGLLLTLLLLVIIDQYERRRRFRILLLLPPLFYLWACLHGSFLLGLFLAGAWLAVKITEKILGRIRPYAWLDLSREMRSKELWTFTAALVAAAALTLLTPYRLELYSFLEGYRDTFYQSHIQEWLPQFIFPLHYWQLLYLAAGGVAMILYLYHACGRQRQSKINLWTIFLAVLFFCLAWRARRHFPLFFIVTLPFMVRVYGTVGREMIAYKKRSIPTWLKVHILVCLLLATVAQIARTNFIFEPFQAYCRNYPCQAAEFLAGHPEYDERNIFNLYGWGGYLIWRLPERQLFIDGRLPQVRFAGHTFLEEYYDFFQAENIPAKLEEYDIGLVLIPAQDKRLTLRSWEKRFFAVKEEELMPPNHLRDHLQTDPAWRPLWRDAASILYVKD